MATGGRSTMEDLLVNLQCQQEADADENRKAIAALHSIVDKLGSTVIDLSKKSIEMGRGESISIICEPRS